MGIRQRVEARAAAGILTRDFARVITAALALAVAVPVGANQPAAGTGAAACLGCHENPKVRRIVDTPHADFDDPRSPASREQCESCHGPSATHIQFPMHVGNIRFTHHEKTPIAERNAACLACHDKGQKSHWSSGAHGENLQCGDCHRIHEVTDPALVAENQNERCATCHEKILPTAPAGTAHPLVGAESLVCSKCHNPHGPTDLAACGQCHPMNAATIARQSPKAQIYHPRAIEAAIDCTACHKGFVHAMPTISRAVHTDTP